MTLTRRRIQLSGLTLDTSAAVVAERAPAVPAVPMYGGRTSRDTRIY